MKLPVIICFLASAGLALAQGPTIGTCPVLPADNIWNTPVDTLPVSTSSSTWVTTIGASTGMHADFGSGLWAGGPIGIPFVKVTGTQTKYAATFLYNDESDQGPYAVPLNAPIEGGSASTGDRHAIAVDVDNCVLYELYRAFPQTSSWEAGSGAIYNLRSNALRPASWTSADAAGLAMVPGLVRYDEVAAGEIRHALRFTVPNTRRAYVWPARHYASSLTDAKYPAMGQRFRLKASFDISSFPADVQVILHALKKYGMMISDNGSAWYLSGEPDSRWNNDNLSKMRNVPGSAFEAIDVASLMIDATSGQAQSSTAVSVNLTPATATLTTGAAQQFSATVQNAASQAVTWSVNGILGGTAQLGSIDLNGRYTAPSLVPSPAAVTIQATTVATPAVTGSAAVTIRYPAPVVSSATPNPLTTGSFTLTVNGSGFQSGAVVRLGATARTTTFVSATQLKATGSTTTTGSAIPVTVTNPDGQASNAVNIAVSNPTTPVSGVGGGPASANLAIGKIATQSSTIAGYSSALASAAVDGNTDGDFFHGSVTHTNADAFSWWQVDLGSSAAIDSIAIWNRTDCCGSRLGSFWVFASNVEFSPADSLQSLLNRGATFSSFLGQAPGPSVEIPLNGVRARYVKVVSTSSDPLSLAEVQVFGTTVTRPVNLALGKAATQSSTLTGYPSAAASSAVDGNTNGGFFSGSVTHTNLESNPWWQVDLGTPYSIDTIAIFNRTDACCVGRLSDFTVYTSDTPFGPSETPATLTGGYRASGNEGITVLSFSAAHGRYVRIQLNGTNNLSLAEVQVLGALGGPSNLAAGKIATQSSTLANYSTTGAGLAVDGNTNGNFFSGSVTHTNSEPNPWWQADLGASSSITSITIWNRTDCCADRLSDYWVFVSDTPFSASDTPAILQNRAQTSSRHTVGAPSPSTTINLAAQGRYVRIQLLGTNSLSLAEVQVIGP